MGMRKHDVIGTLVAIGLCQAAGLIGSLFTTHAIDTWYASLVTPSVSPPNWVFAPVWTTLFTLMGIAAYLVWREGISKRRVQIALVVFVVQLILNLLWSVLFFGTHSLVGALIEVILLWGAILATIVSFATVSRLAAWLLVPYLLWVSFAAYLTYSFWVLN